MKGRLFSVFRRDAKAKEKVAMTATSVGGDAQPRLVRRPARKFSKRLRRSDSLTGTGLGGSRRRRNAFHGAFASRSSRLCKQLSQAVGDKDSAKVREILDSISDMEDLNDGFDVLHQACENKDLSTVAVLLRYGAMVNTMGGRDCAPIHIAARTNSLGIASLLLSHGSYPNIGTKFEKRTPLHIASTLGNVDMVKFLLENSAKVDQGDIYGSTALHMAGRMGHLAVARALLDGGAGVDTYNNDGWTSLHLAAESGNIAMVRLLIERHANVDSQNRFGRTPLHWASTCGHLQVVELLLRHNSNTTLVDLHGKTALDHAASERIRAAIRAVSPIPESDSQLSVNGWPSKVSSPIGQLVLLDSRSRRELCASGHISRETLAEEEAEEERRRTESIDNKEVKRGSPQGVFTEMGSDSNEHPGFVHQDIRPFLSWTDCRSADTDSGRGSSGTASSIWGTLPSKNGSLARYVGLRCASSAFVMSPGGTEASRDEDWNGDGYRGSEEEAWSLEHLATVRETRNGRNGEIGEMDELRPTGERLAFCKNQLGRLRDVFRARTHTLERSMGKVVKETSMALEDGSLKYMTDTLHSTRSAMQALQGVMDEFTIQFDGHLTLTESNVASLISSVEESEECFGPGPLDVFFHFVVSYVAQYVDGWRRLIQGLSLPMDEECEALKMVTKAATSDDYQCRHRSMPDIAGHLVDHLLTTDLTVCALSFVQRHLDETSGAKSVIRRVFELVNDIFEGDSSRLIVRNFVRLTSSVNNEGELPETLLDKFCTLTVKQLGDNSTMAASLSRRLLLCEWKSGNLVPPRASIQSPEGVQTSLEETISNWRRKRATDGSSTLLEDTTDLLLILIDIGREDLASRYCRS